MNQRISILVQGRIDNPNDPFYLYGLALEYIDTDSPRALELFIECRQVFPNYLPTYYMLGKEFEKAKRDDDAVKAYEQGTKIATEQNNHKAKGELSTAIMMID